MVAMEMARHAPVVNGGAGSVVPMANARRRTVAVMVVNGGAGSHGGGSICGGSDGDVGGDGEGSDGDGGNGGANDKCVTADSEGGDRRQRWCQWQTRDGGRVKR